MFCKLEKDEKTYNYLKQFISYVKEEKINNVVELDQYIQKAEIVKHLENNGFHEKDRKEILNWIDKNGKAFRDYLNTIKIASILWCMNNLRKEFEWDDFCGLLDKINMNTSCLETIHN